MPMNHLKVFLKKVDPLLFPNNFLLKDLVVKFLLLGNLQFSKTMLGYQKNLRISLVVRILELEMKRLLSNTVQAILLILLLFTHIKQKLPLLAMNWDFIITMNMLFSLI